MEEPFRQEDPEDADGDDLFGEIEDDDISGFTKAGRQDDYDEHDSSRVNDEALLDDSDSEHHYTKGRHLSVDSEDELMAVKRSTSKAHKNNNIASDDSDSDHGAHTRPQRRHAMIDSDDE